MMNKRIKHFAQRAILIMAPFLFIACEKSTGEIGLDQVIDSKAVLGKKLGLPIVAYTSAFDSILSTGASQDIAGSYIDPSLGGVNASFNTHLLLSLLNPNFGDEPVCDSVVMFLAYRGYYGDTSMPATFVVTELGEELKSDIKYYSNYNFALGKELGRVTTVASPKTLLIYGTDTLSPGLKLNLDKDYFQENLINSSRLSKQYFINNTEFVKHVNGINVSTEGYSNGLYYFNIGSLSSYIKVYYRGNPADTVSQVYEMYYGVFSSGNYISVNSFSQDFTLGGPNLETQDTINGEATVYSQAMGGAVAKIVLPNLKEFKDSSWIINRAEIILPVREGSVSKYPLPGSFLLLEDSGDQRLLIDDYRSGGLSVDGNLEIGYLREKNYTFNITRLVHRYINTEDTIHPLIVLPASSASQGWRAVLNGNQDPVKPMEFNIYYTKTKK